MNVDHSFLLNLGFAFNSSFLVVSSHIVSIWCFQLDRCGCCQWKMQIC